MKILAVHADFRFSNTPKVDITVALPDPGDGKERKITLQATDEAARTICEMIDNPAKGGTGQVATGGIHAEEIARFVIRRVEADSEPTAALTLVQMANDARAAADAAASEFEEKQAAIAALDVAIAAKRAEALPPSKGP